jgi:hypothetical protein
VRGDKVAVVAPGTNVAASKAGAVGESYDHDLIHCYSSKRVACRALVVAQMSCVSAQLCRYMH